MTWLPDYNGVKLGGRITDAGGNGVAGDPVILSFPGSGTDIDRTLTNEQGDFYFLLDPGEGEKDVVFTLPRADLRMNLEEPFWNGLRSKPDMPVLKPDAAGISYLKKRFAYLQLQKRFNIAVFAGIVSPAVKEENSRKFYSDPDVSIKASDYIKLDSLTEYFWELVPSARFVRKKDNYSIEVFNPLTTRPFEDPPGIFFDGVFYQDTRQIADMPVEDLSGIEVIENIYYYRDFTFGGIVDIHTLKGDFGDVKLQPEMVRVMFPLGSPREYRFISPDYSGPGHDTKIPDLRSLLFWNPEVIIPPGEESAKVEFYTGDVTGDFIISVTGITGDGEIVHTESGFGVR